MRISTVGLAAACIALSGGHTWNRPVLDGATRPHQQNAGASPATPTIFIDAGVTDENGRAVTTLRPQDLSVTVDGERRPVVSLRLVYRGPGAETAAALADPAREAPAAAERARSLVMLVDENAVERGQQKPVVAVVNRLLDELGTSDQAAVATLPRPEAQLTLTANPAERQPALARVSGRATSEALAAAQPAPRPLTDTTDPSGEARAADPDEQARIERERQAARDRRAALDDPDGGSGEGSPAAASMRALRGVIDGLVGLRGLKSVIVFRQVGWASDTRPPDDVQGAASGVLAAAARARVVVHLVVVGQAGRKRDVRDHDIGAIAASTGGTITVAKNASDSRAFDGIRAALWGGYVVEVEGREGDTAPRPHAVKVECARPRTTVRAPGLWVARQDPVPTPVAAAPPRVAPVGQPASATPAAASPQPAARLSRAAKVDDPELTILRARLSEYLAAYVRDFRNVVAEEDYVQRLVRGGSDQRHLKSDLLLVLTNDETGWTQYRDVFEVDGRPVRDREARVQKLFLENPADAPRLAREVSDEGARYNVGTVFRNINTPTLPLEYLSPKRIGGLSFWRDGEETVEGIGTVRLAFEELARPTMVQPDNGRADIPASGTYWVDPSSGRILKTRITLAAGRSEMTTTVGYKPAQSLGLWVPSEMNERYNTPTEAIEGHAGYRNFRSFKVTTETQIK